MIFMAGVCWGLHETVSHHWPIFEKRVYWVDAQWWNPAESWKNKYENRDPLQGSRFPGSTTVFVMVTDAKHFFSFNYFWNLVIGASLIGYWLRSKANRYHFLFLLFVACVFYLMHGAGFHLVYTVIFR